MTRISMMLLALLVHLPVLGSEPDEGAQLQFDQLKQLQGAWVPEDSQSGNFYIEFELTAGDSVLVEKWLYKGGLHSMTVYHRDHGSVLATHYCPQGNQPRLASVADTSPSEIRFVFRDATSLNREKQSFQVTLSFLVDETGNRVVRSETYQKGAEQEPSEMVLVRRAPVTPS